MKKLLPSEDAVVEAKRERKRTQRRARYALNPQIFKRRNLEARLKQDKDQVRKNQAAYRALNREALRIKNRTAFRDPEKSRNNLRRSRDKGTAFLDTFKKSLNGGRCNHAGCLTPWQACDIDHIDPARKTRELSQCLTAESIQKEITRNTDPDGTIQLQLLCPVHHRMKTCKAEKKRNDSEKMKLVNEWRESQNECQICKVTVAMLPLKCFDCDHIDRTTKVKNVNVMVWSSYTISQVREELTKCRLLCATCHRVHTAKQFGWRWANALTLRPMPQ